jgi:hypothetical protein
MKERNKGNLVRERGEEVMKERNNGNAQKIPKMDSNISSGN